MNNVPAEYFFIDMTDGSRIGPISEMKFYEKMHSGEIRAETPVWKTGENEWSTFEYVREKWFPETRAQPVDHLTTDTSIACFDFVRNMEIYFQRNQFLAFARRRCSLVAD